MSAPAVVADPRPAAGRPRVGFGSLDGFATVTLAAGALRAAFAPELGMAGVSLTHDGDELLDRRDGPRAYAATGAVMGIPLLHPWANRLAGFDYELEGRTVTLPAGPPLVHVEEHGLPIHGLLGASPHWRVVALDADTRVARVRAALDFATQPDLLAAFPFPHTLELEAALDARALTVRTTLTATGAVAVPVAFGFHPYLRLPGIDRTQWRVDLPARRPLHADARGIPTAAGRRRPRCVVPLDGLAFDDGFDGIADGAAFGVSGGGRTLAVRFLAGYPVAQVFSPAGAEFICFEPMTAPTNALRSGADLRRVRPGESFEAVIRIEVHAD